MKILLFDMDGVLLEAHGYHRALQETVSRMASALDMPAVSLSQDTIAAFEAAGITSEWDTAAICSALLLQTVWEIEPERTLPESLSRPPLPDKMASAGPEQASPDFHALALRLAEVDLLALPPLARAEHCLLETDRYTPAQESLLQNLLRKARSPEESLTHRTFQELVLGSEEFSRVYKLPAALDTASYLLKFDHSNLPPAESVRLRDWLASAGRAGVIMTSRPSRPPKGVFSTPEAEQGAALVGLTGIPIAGWGGLCWLGRQQRVDPQTFLKPSPVHGLTALRLAMGALLEEALTEAANLSSTGVISPIWESLTEAQVFVFEDTPGGINSICAAQALLGSAGISIETKFLGIAQSPVKVQALLASGAQIFATLPDALAPVL